MRYAHAIAFSRQPSAISPQLSALSYQPKAYGQRLTPNYCSLSLCVGHMVRWDFPQTFNSDSSRTIRCDPWRI
ncbi:MULTISPECIES: hypothetical protein [unclassified Moorena]|uniref:hypothetical protein n=1 Tax=unclassified Moorena TaxID=2683338 RepID=UPI0013B8ADDA|nr:MULTISPECIES: hypothetical protein [unclassified Moorena]NEQ08035.1 hypothetical protein [Moorena sp. SIO4E2]NEQ17024.1 hypothetical protein [Moorena sp. SIO3E2]NER90895.1 hypothetical protein [Moorena sp. SIO3A2]NES41252.1 hypothetical protein [Moorena sp. SIO2C4]